MATITTAQLLSQRATAGTRYTNAVAELRAAMIDLAALDAVVANRNVPMTAANLPVRSFTGDADWLPPGLRHPVYAPGFGEKNWNDEIRAALNNYLATNAYVP